MKKAILLLIVAVMSSLGGAMAQTWISGSMGYNYSKSSYDSTHGDAVSKGHYVTLSPNVGFDLTDRLTVGGGGTLQWSQSRFEVEREHSESLSINRVFGVSAFVRYYAFELGKLRIFAQGDAIYRWQNSTQSDSKPKTLTLSLTPGVTYPLTSHLGVVASFGGLNWRLLDANYTVKDLYLTLATDFELGVYWYIDE